ncbi:MAG: 30S ribosomal protein S3 [Candidatus Aenigmarchaeota archaeon]|nr:30S ribosomal protein S3 [Candidatus Aenigmarchaeota archaeon]
MKDQVFIKEYIKKYFADTRCGDVEIQYTPLGTRIIIYTTSPGLVIGTGGDRIREVTDKLKNEFGIDNPQIDVQKIQEPDLDPHIVASSIASGLENRINFKRLGKYHLERVMRAGAIGCEIIIKGKISGEKARKERFVAGYIKKSGEPRERDVIFGRVVANPPLGNIAVNVSIMIRHSDKKIEIERPVSKPQQEEIPATPIAETTE